MVSKNKTILNFTILNFGAMALILLGLFIYCLNVDANNKVATQAPPQATQEQEQPVKVKELSEPEHLKELIAQYEKDLKKLNDDQLAVMLTVADLAFDYDLAYTAAAQVWTESEFGKYPVDLAGLSCGLGHKRMNFYVKEAGLPDSSFSQNKQCSLFMSDHKLAMEVYLKDFNYWRNYHISKGASKKEAYIKAIKSYNAGKHVNSEAAKRYYDKVHARVIVLQKHFDFPALVANMRNGNITQMAAR